jgi:hypothetical protein
MKRRALTVAVVVALLGSSVAAWAGSTAYAVSSVWWPGQGAGSSYSASWVQNGFYKPIGFDATVTFIDNVSYSWHATRRDPSTWTVTHWFSSQVKKGHCRANAKGGYGACTVFN